MPLTEEVRERIRQGLIRYYQSPAGKARIKEMEGKPPSNKGLPGPAPWNKGLKGLYSMSTEARRRVGRANKKQIRQYDKSGKFLKIWPGVVDAARELGISYMSIIANANHYSKSAGGYIWSYYEIM